jgi:hypothetical protein
MVMAETEAWSHRELVVRHGKRHRSVFPLMLFLFVVISGIIVAAIFRYSGAPQLAGTRIQMRAVQVFLNSELGISGDSRAIMGPENETEIKDLGGHRFEVNGWVQYLTGAGLSRNYYYSCTIRETPQGDWTKEDLNLFEQD